MAAFRNIVSMPGRRPRHKPAVIAGVIAFFAAAVSGPGIAAPPAPRTVALEVEKPLFLNARAGTRKSGIACIASDTLFGRDFVKAPDLEFLLRRELAAGGIAVVDPPAAPREGQVNLAVSLEKIAAQLCSPSIGLFGSGAGTEGKVIFTFLIRQRIGLGPDQPVRATDIIVDTRAFGEKLPEEAYFPKAVSLLARWMMDEWGWQRPSPQS